MTDLADRTIDLLRHEHDRLADLARRAGDAELARPSGAGEWSVAQVLSHLGSAAEIFLGALTGEEVDPQAVWARWDAATPREQADGFVEHHGRLVEHLEGLDAEARTTTTVTLGFLPEPVALSTFAGMRAVEVVLHGWDAQVALDPQATLSDEAAVLLAEHYEGGLGFLLGFSAKADQLPEPATVVLGDSGYALDVSDTVRVTTTPGAPTATLLGPLEAAVRLLGGRLGEDRTPEGVEVTGNVTLDDLRRVFPGY